MPTPIGPRTVSTPAGAPLARPASVAPPPAVAPQKLDAQDPTKRGPVPAALAGADALQRSQAAAQAVVALKTLIAGASLDANGLLKTADKAQLNPVQLGNALKAIFGPDGAPQLLMSQGNAFDLSPANSAFAALKQILRAVHVEGNDIVLDQGRVSGDASLKAALGNLFGQDLTAFADGRLEIVDSKVASIAAGLKLAGSLGPLASIDGAVLVSGGPAGLGSVQALAAYQALLAGGKVSVGANGQLAIDRGKLTRAQLGAALTALFGPAAVTGDLSATWKPGAGVDANLVAGVARLFGKTEVGAGGQIQLKNGAISDAGVAADLKTAFGDAVLVADGALQFRDGSFVSADLAQQLTTKLGPAGSLDATFQATLDREGLASATAMAAFKAVRGSTTIDGSGKLVFARGALTSAQFQAALSTLFGASSVGANVGVTWSPPDGTLSATVDQLKAVLGAVTVSGDNALTVKPGGLDDDLQAAVTGVFGTGLSLDTSGSLELRDSHFISASVDADLVKQFGSGASLDADFKATFDAQGLATGEVLAAYKTLLGGADNTLDASGKLVFTNRGLTSAQFDAALSTVFGDGALSGSAGVSWSPPDGTLAAKVADVKLMLGALSLGANGELEVDRGKLSGSLDATLADTFGPGLTLSSDDAIVFKDDAFVSAKLKEAISAKLGSAGNLDATFDGTFTAKGLEDASLFAAMKTVVAGAKLDANGKLVVSGGKLSEVEGALSLIAGRGLKADASGAIAFDGSGKFSSASFEDAFSSVIGATKVGAQGKLQIDGKGVSGDVQAKVRQAFGDRAAVEASGEISFDDTGLRLDAIQAQVALGGGTTIDASFRMRGGAVDGTIAIAAVQKLKALSGADGIAFKENGTVEIKDGKIDRAEVSALISAAAGSNLSLTTDGHLVDANGKLSGDVAGKLKLAFDSTSLDASGKLTFNNGKLSVADGAKLSALFGGAKLQAGGAITVTGADQQRVDLSLKALGGALDSSGSLDLDHGRIAALSLTSNLVFGSADKPSFDLKGLVAVQKGAAKIDVDQELTSGMLTEAAGVSASVSVAKYKPSASNPDDAVRLATKRSYQIWQGQFADHLSVGVTAAVGPAGIPVTVGFKVGAGSSHSAQAIAVASAPDATPPLVTVLRPPATADDVLAMHPGEAWSDQADHDVLIGGNVALGSRVPGTPIGITVGGDVSYALSGNLKRQIERLDGDRVRVKVMRGKGSVAVEAISVGANLDANGLLKGRLPGGDAVNALAAKAMPMLEKVASLGFKDTWEQGKEDDVAFDLVFDLSNPKAEGALTRLLHDDFSEAQKQAGAGDGGVVLEQAVRTSLRSESDDASFSAGPLTTFDVSKWLDQKVQTMDPKGVSFEETLDGTTQHKAFLPWNGKWNSDVKLVHKSLIAASSDQVKGLGAIDGTTTIGRPFDEGPITDGLSFVTVQVGAGSGTTSVAQVDRYTGAGSALLDQMGWPPEQRQGFGELAAGIDAGRGPKRSGPLFGLVDGTFGATSMAIEGLVTPKGIENILGKSAGACVATYLEIAGGTADVDRPLIASKRGIAMKIAKQISDTKNVACVAVPAGGGDYQLIDQKSGAKWGMLSDGQLAAVQAGVAKLVASPQDDDGGNPGDQQEEVHAKNVGAWEPGRAAPDPLFVYDGWDAIAARSARSDARDFATRIAAGQALVAKSSGMDSGAFFDQIDALFRQLMKNQMEPRLAFLALAGTDGAYVRGGIALAPAAVQAMAANGLAVKPNPAGADFAFSAGTLPAADSDLRAALPDLDAASGDWMARG